MDALRDRQEKKKLKVVLSYLVSSSRTELEETLSQEKEKKEYSKGDGNSSGPQIEGWTECSISTTYNEMLSLNVRPLQGQQDAQRVKVTATKPNNPNSTPGTDRVKREPTPPGVLLPPRVCHAMSRHLHTHKINKM